MGAIVLLQLCPVLGSFHVQASAAVAPPHVHALSAGRLPSLDRVCLLAIADDGCERNFVFQLRLVEESWRIAAIEGRACPEQ